MDPNIWGPKFWFALHSVSFTYPFYPDENDKKNYKTFFSLLEYVLPCVVCRVNFGKNIKQYPIDNHLSNRKSLALWVMDLHNMVNVENGKPILTHKEILDMYEKMYGRKIHLEDPEPHITNGKKLSDEEWKHNQEMKKWHKRIMINVKKYFLLTIFIILLLVLGVAIFFLKKKIKISL